MSENSWEEVMWDELHSYPEPQQIVVASEFIARMSRHLMGDLARHRREVAVTLIQGGRYTYGSLAEEIGNQTGTVRRLVEEGRAQRRDAVRDIAA